MLVGMKFNELDEDDQKKVRDALRNSPESKKRDEALRTVEKETYALLRELREEPMTVGALFVVFTAAAAFANDAISRDSAKWGDYGFAMRHLLIRYSDDESFREVMNNFGDANEAFNRALDAKADEMFGDGFGSDEWWKNN
jgi:hypothetical protein